MEPCRTPMETGRWGRDEPARKDAEGMIRQNQAKAKGGKSLRRMRLTMSSSREGQEDENGIQAQRFSQEEIIQTW